MEPLIKTNQKTIAIELAEAIATFKIEKIADMLSEDGEFSI